MIESSHFNLAFVSESSILTTLKSTQVSKAAGLDSLSGHFLMDGAKFCNLSINSEKFPDLCKVAKHKPLYKKVFLTQPCSYRPISLLPLIFEVIRNSRSNNAFPEFEKFIIHLPIWFSKKVSYELFPFLFE